MVANIIALPVVVNYQGGACSSQCTYLEGFVYDAATGRQLTLADLLPEGYQEAALTLLSTRSARQGREITIIRAMKI